MERYRDRNGRYRRTERYFEEWPRKSISELRGWLLSDPSVVVGESTHARGLPIVWRAQPNGASPSILLHCNRCKKNRRYLYHCNALAVGEARYVCQCSLGLKHKVKSVSASERIRRKMWAAEARLCEDGGKPHRMRWATYDRLVTEANYQFTRLFHPSLPMVRGMRKLIWGTCRLPKR